ncbi:small integral membrane protein 12-A [Drosophila innubila]|uniref:small integral membrane protein 12-A n=1 Tax=Drosophila innubila TaxID=198719 RepID=UPI00148CFB11|nr:small integral membrane protein 12-A [Drosophila innubila]
MWPVIMALLRRNAVYFTLPVAVVVGFVGYNLESIISDKHTPYSPSIQEMRANRLTDDTIIETAANVEKLQLKSPVLERNLSPSLQPKA